MSPAPAISSLLDDGFFEYPSFQLAPLYNPIRSSPGNRPHPVEPSTSDEAPATSTRKFSESANSGPSGALSSLRVIGPSDEVNEVNEVTAVQPLVIHDPIGSSGRGPKSAVPLAEVLNNEDDNPHSSQEARSRKRCKLDRCEANDFVQLPKPPVKKSIRRPRIPPLLQGLHHPPPDAGLFPPITAEKPTRNVSGDSLVAVPSGDTGDHVVQEESQTRPDTQLFESGKAKRKKWSEEETTHLLKGVAMFGIGSWKKILLHEDFSFHNRTAVDLKDREYRSFTGSVSAISYAMKHDSISGDKAKTKSSMSLSSLLAPNSLSIDPLSHLHQKPKNSRSHRMTTADLAQFGIQEPFQRANRRARRVFTGEEDTAILRGVEKYQGSWSRIRNDSDLGLASRKPTDLRDRFRTRYPEKYAEIGLKVRPDGIPNPNLVSETSAVEKSVVGSSSVAAKSKDTATTTALSTEATNLTGTGETQSALNLRTMSYLDQLFDDNVSLHDDDDKDASPITLDRSIVDWGTQNIAPMSRGIDPLMTLNAPKLPTVYSSTVIPSFPFPSSLLGDSSTSNNINHGRYRTVNLPPPGDLLSGLDGDGRSELHAAAFPWESSIT